MKAARVGGATKTHTLATLSPEELTREYIAQLAETVVEESTG